MAAAAMTPRESATAFMPASLPGVIFIPSVYIGKSKAFHDRCLDRLLDNLVDRQPRFGPLDLVALGFGRRVARREQRAAVLVGNDRDRIGPEALGLGRDFLLVHAHER